MLARHFSQPRAALECRFCTSFSSFALFFPHRISSAIHRKQEYHCWGKIAEIHKLYRLKLYSGESPWGRAVAAKGTKTVTMVDRLLITVADYHHRTTSRLSRHFGSTDTRSNKVKEKEESHLNCRIWSTYRGYVNPWTDRFTTHASPKTQTACDQIWSSLK